MINYAAYPDRVFDQIITISLDEMGETIHACSAEDYREFAPFEICHFFPREMLLLQIDILGRCHKDREYYYIISEYHWRILHAALSWFTDYWNDIMTASERRRSPPHVGKLDFDTIFATYFWDEDCLSLPDIMQTQDVDDLITWNNREVYEQLGLTDRSITELLSMAKGVLPPDGKIKVSMRKLSDVAMNDPGFLPAVVGRRYPRIDHKHGRY